MITYYEIEYYDEDNLLWDVIHDAKTLKDARKRIKEYMKQDKLDGTDNIHYRIIANMREIIT